MKIDIAEGPGVSEKWSSTIRLLIWNLILRALANLAMFYSQTPKDISEQLLNRERRIRDGDRSCRPV